MYSLYMRLLIYVTPRRVLWWPDGDMTAEPRRIERVDATASASPVSEAPHAG